MDLKNIKWAGKFYQKFEAMCLDIDGATFEDTVKFVENQKQKVGVTVKKLYSEIVGDLLPPSSADPVKLATGDLSLKPYAHIDTTNLRILDDEKKSDNEVKSSVPNSAYHLSPQIAKKLKEYQQRSNKSGPHKRPPQKNSLTRKSSSFSEELNATSTSEVVLSYQANASLKLPSSSDEKVSSETSGQKENDFECASSASEIISSAEYMQQNQNECDSPALDKDGSDSTSSGRDSPSKLIGSRSSACEVETMNMEVMATNTDASMKDGSFSKLEEDCVLVEKDEFPFVQGMDKQKPYMKKIKSSRKQDLLVCKSGKNNNTRMMSTPARDSFESEWELI